MSLVTLASTTTEGSSAHISADLAGAVVDSGSWGMEHPTSKLSLLAVPGKDIERNTAPAVLNEINRRSGSSRGPLPGSPGYAGLRPGTGSRSVR